MKKFIYLFIAFVSCLVGIQTQAQLNMTYSDMVNKYGSGSETNIFDKTKTVVWKVSDLRIEADFLDNVCISIGYCKLDKLMYGHQSYSPLNSDEIKNAIKANSTGINWITNDYRYPIGQKSNKLQKLKTSKNEEKEFDYVAKNLTSWDDKFNMYSFIDPKKKELFNAMIKDAKLKIESKKTEKLF